VLVRFLNKYLLTEFVLLVIALVARFIFMRIFFIYGVVRSISKWELRKYFRACAYITDVEGNVKGQYILNDTMRKRGGHDFGDPLESISYAIGRNNRLEKQTWFSKKVERILLESAEKNHCDNAVRNLDNQLLNRIMYLN
jgi:hypothetical protein